MEKGLVGGLSGGQAGADGEQDGGDGEQSEGDGRPQAFEVGHRDGETTPKADQRACPRETPTDGCYHRGGETP